MKVVFFFDEKNRFAFLLKFAIYLRTQSITKKNVLKVWWSILIFETFSQSELFDSSIALFCYFLKLRNDSCIYVWTINCSKMNSSPQNKTVLNLMSFQTCDFPSSFKHKRKYFKNVGNQTILVTLHVNCKLK